MLLPYILKTVQLKKLNKRQSFPTAYKDFQLFTFCPWRQSRSCKQLGYNPNPEIKTHFITFLSLKVLKECLSQCDSEMRISHKWFFFSLGKGFAFSKKLRPLAASLATLCFLSQASPHSGWNCFCVYNLIKTMMATVYIIQTIEPLQ